MRVSENPYSRIMYAVNVTYNIEVTLSLENISLESHPAWKIFHTGALGKKLTCNG